MFSRVFYLYWFVSLRPRKKHSCSRKNKCKNSVVVAGTWRKGSSLLGCFVGRRCCTWSRITVFPQLCGVVHVLPRSCTTPPVPPGNNRSFETYADNTQCRETLGFRKADLRRIKQALAWPDQILIEEVDPTKRIFVDGHLILPDPFKSLHQHWRNTSLYFHFALHYMNVTIIC